jgi:hypothetical protein
MKKLLALITVLLFASFALAQNNTATVDQSGGGSNSTVNSQANGATVDILQVGSTSNSAITSQSGSTGLNNELFIKQTGVSNQVDALQTGDGNLADVEQTAAINNSIIGASPGIIQNGSGNKLVNAANGGVFDPLNPASQISAEGSNALDVEQQGNDHKVGLYQKGIGNNSATVLQDYGNRNELTVWQNGVELLARMPLQNNLQSSQLGYDNIARLAQIAGIGHKNGAEILQDGDFNVLGLNRSSKGAITGSATQKSSKNETSLFLSQTGNYNQVGLNQYNGHTNTVGEAIADITQYGNSNYLSALQEIRYQQNAELYVDQLGSSNEAGITQRTSSSLNGLYAEITQHGDNNVLRRANSDGTIHGTNVASQLGGTEITLDLYQSGDGNQVGLTQDGNGYNLAEIVQMNGGNTLGAYQTTSSGFNSLDVYQSGSANAKVMQTGAGNNTATITQ